MPGQFSLGKQWLKINFIWVRLYQTLKVWVVKLMKAGILGWRLTSVISFILVFLSVSSSSWVFFLVPLLQLLQLYVICPQTNIMPPCPLHQCTYFRGTSRMHSITTDYLIPPALALLAWCVRVCVRGQTHKDVCLPQPCISACVQ